jgi:hypothetical protein
MQGENAPHQRKTASSISGRISVVVMLLIGVALAGFAIWRQSRDEVRSRAFWGPKISDLIATAPSVSVLRLEPEGTEGAGRLPRVRFAGLDYVAVKSVNISTSLDLNAIRRSLLTDANFEWDAEPARMREMCEYALVFTNGANSSALGFSPRDRYVTHSEGAWQILDSKFSTALEEFVQHQFAR